MRIIVARHMGFCGGVRRAVEIALRTAEKHNATYTWGPLIHNPQEVARLERAGVRVARKLEELDGEAFVVSAYGVEEAVLETARRKGMEIVDATCPVVTGPTSSRNSSRRRGTSWWRWGITGTRRWSP
jgi:4-hydroxy-3-methylbut-2-enyl diphosphate reductase